MDSAKSSVWLAQTLNSPDQLRQRVAWALSQVLVAAVPGTTLELYSEAWMNYYDIFVRHAFGSFRDVLREVTYSPVMGVYLDGLKNKAFDFAQSLPNENYAREIMQLFSIGMWMLNPTGPPSQVPTAWASRPTPMSISLLSPGSSRALTRSRREVTSRDPLTGIIQIISTL
jgi:hypothetical protein